MTRSHMATENRAFVYEVQRLRDQIVSGEHFTKDIIKTMWWDATTSAASCEDHNELRVIAEAIYPLSGGLTPENPLSLDELQSLWEDATAAE